jgi:hypothetical protein
MVFTGHEKDPKAAPIRVASLVAPPLEFVERNPNPHPAGNLEAPTFKEGQRVTVRNQPPPRPGKIAKVLSGGLYDVNFSDGGKGHRVAAKSIKAAEGPQLSGEHTGEHAPLGARIAIYYRSEKKYYRGTVGDSMDAEGRVTIFFDDGDEHRTDMRKRTWQLLENEEVVLMPVKFEKGKFKKEQRVTVQYVRLPRMGKIAKVLSNGTYNVDVVGGVLDDELMDYGVHHSFITAEDSGKQATCVRHPQPITLNHASLKR